jgi:hypothetical protein
MTEATPPVLSQRLDGGVTVITLNCPLWSFARPFLPGARASGAPPCWTFVSPPFFFSTSDFF